MTKYDDLEEVIGSLKERLSEMTAISEMQTKIASITEDVNDELEKVEAVKLEFTKFIGEISSNNDSFTKKITEDLAIFTSDITERLDVISSEIAEDRENNESRFNSSEDRFDELIDKLNTDLSELRDLITSSITKTVSELQSRIQGINDTTMKESLELRKQIGDLIDINDGLNTRVSDLDNKLNDVKKNLENEKRQSLAYQHNNDRKVVIALILGLIGISIGIIGIII